VRDKRQYTTTHVLPALAHADFPGRFQRMPKPGGGEFLHSLNSSGKTTLWTNPGEKLPSAKPTDWGGKMKLGSKMLKNQGGDF
jgi:hypothetical protein